ncbi:hsp71-like protein [Gigaspora margarita]|uniref:Hsp71-like protein n=1 Tax=Gigaspora margarita TaxID=4874 RepID=A0A8H4AAM7_GIGMA|nr:hsp71-like protein [Gigaspora margarita]
MVADAEKYRAEDEKDEKVAGKIDIDDKKKLEDVIKEAITWLENNQETVKKEYEQKQKSFEETANPIMMKLYG